jgi:hypothetical protein
VPAHSGLAHNFPTLTGRFLAFSRLLLFDLWLSGKSGASIQTSQLTR